MRVKEKKMTNTNAYSLCFYLSSYFLRGFYIGFQLGVVILSLIL